MKFMMNGALTLGTLDGANIEIKDLVGEKNIFIFGLTADEVLNYNGYRSIEYYHYDKRIRKVVDQLVNGFFPNVDDEFEAIYDSLLMENDQYFVLRDFDSYVKAHQEVGEAFMNKEQWLKKSLTNIAMSGHFSSDRTIREYAKDIWKLEST